MAWSMAGKDVGTVEVLLKRQMGPSHLHQVWLRFDGEAAGCHLWWRIQGRSREV
jgi:hypothetical protein